MSSLEERLRRALDRDAPKGFWSLLRRAPADEGRLIARGHEAEAVEATRALLAAPATPARVRQNAIPLLSMLLPVAAAQRPAEEVLADGGCFAKVMSEMKSHLDDPDLEVRVLAAVELLKLASDTDLVELRPRLEPLLPRLRERREDNPAVRQAVLRLGGARDALTWLREIDTTTGPLPPNVGELLDALDQELPEPALLLLPGLFVRLDAIVEQRPPRQMVLGSSTVWDIDTLEAIKAFRIFVRGAGPQGVPAAADLMKAASPELIPVLVAEAAGEGEQAALLSAAAAEDTELPEPARVQAIESLGRLADSDGAGNDTALTKLRRLREDGVLVELIDRALGRRQEARD